MKEKELISIIKSTLDSKYIGDDCAYLKDLGIVVTQDSLIEDIHFSLEYTNPYNLGYKSVMVNISDICASGAEPKYLTISLSLPSDTENKFVQEFYEGGKTACQQCGNIEIAGGDITGSKDKIYISICAIGKTGNRNISSRSYATLGQKIIISGNSGSSSAGLKLLQRGIRDFDNEFVNAHLKPRAQIDFSKNISLNTNYKYAMMDTSDGLMEALSAIAKESNVHIDIDFSKIPHSKNIEIFDNWHDLILFGGEDYQLVASVDKNCPYGIEIGKVKEGKTGVTLNIDSKSVFYSDEDINKKIYNHFK